jgi:cephalosporin hydroxylase
MKYTIDTEARTITSAGGGTLDLFSKESFDILAKLWTDVGWVRKYSYAFSWMGRPIIKLPEDMVRTQEAIWEVQPDVIVETGVAHGGSLVFYASLFAALKRGRVIGVDVEIRPHNLLAIKAHPQQDRIKLVEGSSTSPGTIQRVKELIRPGEKVMVILDSNHLKDHVAKELVSYCDLVTPGSYLLVEDGIMQDVDGMPRTGADWSWNNPRSAIAEFLATHTDFRQVRPPRPFDESLEVPDCTYHPGGWLRRTDGV